MIKIAILFQLSAAVCLILCKHYVDAGVNLLGVCLGVMTVGMNVADEGFNMQSVLCYLAYSCVFMFWSFVRGVFFYMGKEAPYTLVGWQDTVYQVAILSDVVVYTALTLLTYMLAAELRQVVENATNVVQYLADGNVPYNAVPASPEQAEAIEAGRVPAEADMTPPAKPFSGPSYRLTA